MSLVVVGNKFNVSDKLRVYLCCIELAREHFPTALAVDRYEFSIV